MILLNQDCEAALVYPCKLLFDDISGYSIKKNFPVIKRGEVSI